VSIDCDSVQIYFGFQNIEFHGQLELYFFITGFNKSEFQVSTQMLQTLPDYVEQDLKRRQPLK